MLPRKRMGLPKLTEDKDKSPTKEEDEIPFTGLGPLEDLLRDDAISEIMVIGIDRIYVEQHGQLLLTPLRFTSDLAIVDIAQKLIAHSGRELSQKKPYVDARIAPNNYRITVTIPPFSRSPSITIRKPHLMHVTKEMLLERNMASEAMLTYLIQSVLARKNIIIAGQTGAGKTTIARFLATHIPAEERIISLEETFEMFLSEVHPHVVELETRPHHSFLKEHDIAMDDALKQILHMRPDRIILGEVRHKEAFNLLTAMGTGHPGSFTTLHADSAHDVFSRLAFAIAQGQTQMPIELITAYAARTIHLILYIDRAANGIRRIREIVKVAGMHQGQPILKPCYSYNPTQQRFMAHADVEEGCGSDS